MGVCIKEAASALGYVSLKSEQKGVLSMLLKGKMCLCPSLPDLARLCCAALPLATRSQEIQFHGGRTIGSCGGITSLSPHIKDQVARYSAKGLYITHEITPEEQVSVRQGKFQLLFFFSPEALCKCQWFHQLQPYCLNIVAFVVDEAQCIKK